MKIRTAISALALTLGLASCAVQKNWVSIGGSRSDGTVKLAYEYGGFEKPQLSREQGFDEARRRCVAWGYTAAEPFGGVISQCTFSNQYGCLSFRVEATFQCTGQPEKTSK